jgi:hypothetical protein
MRNRCASFFLNQLDLEISLHSMEVSVRIYTYTDKEDLLDIFHSNCPKYFKEDDLEDFTSFLDTYADERFKVIMSNGKVIGCGGHYIKHSDRVIGIAWVMFRRFSIGRGNILKVSSELFNHILASIQSEGVFYDIVVNTTRLLEKSFERFGFKTEMIIHKGFGVDLDHYVMRRKAQES